MDKKFYFVSLKTQKFIKEELYAIANERGNYSKVAFNIFYSFVKSHFIFDLMDYMVSGQDPSTQYYGVSLSIEKLMRYTYDEFLAEKFVIDYKKNYNEFEKRIENGSFDMIKYSSHSLNEMWSNEVSEDFGELQKLLLA